MATNPGGKSRLVMYRERLLALALFGALALALEALSIKVVGTGFGIGAVVLGLIFKPWRGN